MTTDPELVAYVAGTLLRGATVQSAPVADAAVSALNRGRRRAIRLVQAEARTVVADRRSPTPKAD